jgi:hypothetical protein
VKFVQLTPAIEWGIGVDVGIDLGINVMKGGTVYLGLEVPLFFPVDILSQGLTAQIPILPGAGFEYHVNDFIAIGARFNAGPSIAIIPVVGTNVDFAMIAEGFFMFRWDRVKK